MKIIIYHQEIDRNLNSAGVQVVSHTRTINNLIEQITSWEDIEGFISSDARNNPEFEQILQAIYNHKVQLWIDLAGSEPPGIPIHEKFAKTIKEKFNLDLLKP